VIYQPSSCAGFPIVLSAPGSYRLGGNITGCNAKDGIQITASNVSLDLGGFSVIGVPGSLDGIKQVGLNNQLNIANGTVTSWGGTGLNLTGSARSRVDNIIASSNVDGITLDTATALSNSTASANAGTGISVVASALHVTIRDCNANFNNATGIEASGTGTVVDSCEVGGNGDSGIVAGVSAQVVNNLVAYNGLNGISAQHSCYIENNSVAWNAGTGIAVFTPGNCTIVSNKATANGGPGFWIFGGGGYSLIDSNHASGNGDRGFEIGFANLGYPNIITRNFASANVNANYFIGAYNDAAPIVTAGAAVNPLSNISQ
jgi:parallel beta-helix repeat protein